MIEKIELENDPLQPDDEDTKRVQASAAITAELCLLLVPKLNEIAEQYNSEHGDKLNAVPLADAVFSILVATMHELLQMEPHEQDEIVDFVYFTWKHVIQQRRYSRNTVYVPFASYYTMKMKFKGPAN